jgi:hypothetical protein
MASDSDGIRKIAVGAAGGLATIVLAAAIWTRLPPPQMETDEQVFKTVDALFTALNAKDRARLEECERRLKAYHDEGKTSDAVASRLDSIVKQAEDGQWKPAAKKLYAFILGQRGAS